MAIDNQPPAPAHLEQAIRTLLDVLQQGRKVLVVIGAGASVAAKIPLMSSVFADLRERLEKATLPDAFLVKELRRSLVALERGEAPRSLAAMALGTLQKAHEYTKGEADLHGQLANIWNEFSEKFISGEIGADGPGLGDSWLSGETQARAKHIILSHPFFGEFVQVVKPAPTTPFKAANGKPIPIYRRNPTKLHYLLARWVTAGWANIVSVNFDGLTRSALDRIMREHASGSTKPAAIVLSEPKALRNFAFGSSPGDVPVSPVIKVWGDVFHAVCTNPRCPEADVRVPIFRLTEAQGETTDGATAKMPGESENGEHHCPSCRQRRQLQIFFTGYEEKEMRTQELMDEMVRTVAPQIGCVLTVGFSGLWDESLVRFIATVSGLIERENTPPFSTSFRSRQLRVCRS